MKLLNNKNHSHKRTIVTFYCTSAHDYIWLFSLSFLISVVGSHKGVRNNVLEFCRALTCVFPSKATPWKFTVQYHFHYIQKCIVKIENMSLLRFSYFVLLSCHIISYLPLCLIVINHLSSSLLLSLHVCYIEL